MKKIREFIYSGSVVQDEGRTRLKDVKKGGGNCKKKKRNKKIVKEILRKEMRNENHISNVRRKYRKKLKLNLHVHN